MRLAEATNLRWEDIDFDKDLFTVTGGEQGPKNNQERTIPLFPSLKNLLIRVREESNPADDSEAAPYVIWIGTAKKAIACAIEAGVDFKTISAWVGHSDGGILVAKTYGHLRDIHSAEMAKRMVFEA